MKGMGTNENELYWMAPNGFCRIDEADSEFAHSRCWGASVLSSASIDQIRNRKGIPQTKNRMIKFSEKQWRLSIPAALDSIFREEWSAAPVLDGHSQVRPVWHATPFNCPFN
jgi:hypothetical protein